MSTYLFKSEIDENIRVFDDRAPDTLALDIPKGTRLPLASNIKVATYGEYAWQVNVLGGGDAYLRLQYSYTGDSYNSLRDNDLDPVGTGYGGRVKQPNYHLWDLRAGFSSSDWDIMLYVDNLSDERPVVYHDTNADLFWGRDNIRTSQPRTFGVNVRRHFN